MVRAIARQGGRRCVPPPGMVGVLVLIPLSRVDSRPLVALICWVGPRLCKFEGDGVAPVAQQVSVVVAGGDGGAPLRLGVARRA